MIQKRFEEIVKADIDALIIDARREGRDIEYKEALPGGTDEEKKEFLADFSSFANADGGDLIYGVQEQRDANGKTTGIPGGAVGLALANPDQERLRLEPIIRDGLAPRLHGYQVRIVDGFPQGPVLLFRIRKSWSAPHMIKFKDWSRFYSRNSSGKSLLDVQEIRAAFAFTETLPQRLRAFREERLARIVADETPIRLVEGARLVLHLVPISSLDPGSSLDVETIARQQHLLFPFGGAGSVRYNFDGFLGYYTKGSRGGYSQYVQAFRSGAVETVSADLFIKRGDWNYIPSLPFERDLIKLVRDGLAALQQMEVAPPVFLLLSLLGVRGYLLGTSLELGDPRNQPIDQNDLLFPDVAAAEYGIEAAELLHSTIDALWQAAGWDKSQNYDAEGNWVPKQPK